MGLACGGTIEIFLQAIADKQARQISELIKLSERNESAMVIVDLEGDTLFDIVTKDQINNCTLLEHDALQKVLRQDRGRVIENKHHRYFIQPFNPQLHLFIIGAVHITQHLVPVIMPLGFNVSVVDPRSAFATTERFPGVDLITQWPQQVFEHLKLNHRTAVIALTHDPKFDDPALMAALRSDAFYIGALGSRKTHAGRLQRLKHEGFDDKQLLRIHAPIGLDINASNPAEIAVSIAAEIIQQLRKNDE